jgi:TfoX/Sxy family transcriptional regulator of competence genes
MSYNQSLADRVRNLMNPFKSNISEKHMFGGLAFLYKDKMSCGIINDELMVRVVSDKYEKLLKHPHTRNMDFTGKIMREFLFVEAEAIQSDEELMNWINLGIEHAEKHQEN